MSLLPPAMIHFGFQVTANELISFKGQLKVWTVVNVLTSQILNIPEISAEIIWFVPGTHLTPTSEWLWPLRRKILLSTYGFQIKISWSNPADKRIFASEYQSKE